jgi:ribosomal protein S18 acetylase RimI-like enzyme
MGALDLLKEIAMADQGIEKMKLSTSKNNANGIRIYEKFGFKDTNEMEDGEEVFVMDLAKEK